MCCWITLLCTLNTGSQLYFNKIYILRKNKRNCLLSILSHISNSFLRRRSYKWMSCVSARVYFSVGSPTRERSQAAFQKTARFMLGQRAALQVRVWPRTAGRKRRASGTVAPPHASQSPRRGRTWWKMHAHTDPGLSRDTCKGWTSQPHSLLGWKRARRPPPNVTQSLPRGKSDGDFLMVFYKCTSLIF